MALLGLIFACLLGGGLILAGLLMAIVIYFGAYMSDNPQEGPRALRDLWWCLVPIGVGAVVIYVALH